LVVVFDVAVVVVVVVTTRTTTRTTTKSTTRTTTRTTTRSWATKHRLHSRQPLHCCSLRHAFFFFLLPHLAGSIFLP
jgi:hypothetical protein